MHTFIYSNIHIYDFLHVLHIHIFAYIIYCMCYIFICLNVSLSSKVYSSTSKLPIPSGCIVQPLNYIFVTRLKSV